MCENVSQLLPTFIKRNQDKKLLEISRIFLKESILQIIVTRESCSLEANNALLFYLFVNIFLVPSLLEGASNFCEGAKDMAEGTHAAGYDQKILVYEFHELIGVRSSLVSSS